MCGHPPDAHQPRGSRDSFLHKNNPKLPPGTDRHQRWGLISTSGFEQTDPFPFHNILCVHFSPERPKIALGCSGLRTSKQLLLGQRSRKLNAQPAREERTRGCLRETGGEEKKTPELGDQKEWESRVWEGLGFCFLKARISWQHFFFIHFLGAFPSCAHYSSPESTSKEILNTIISDNPHNTQGEFYPRKDSQLWSKLANWLTFLAQSHF